MKRKQKNEPKRDNAAIEEVEAVAEVAEQAISNNLQEHLEGKETREKVIRVLEDYGEDFGLKFRFFLFHKNTCWWYSTPMERVLTRIATRIPRVK